MDSPLVNLAFMAVVGWGVWRLAQPRPVFRVRIEASQPRVTLGTVTPAFLDTVIQLCKQHALSRGGIEGVVNGGGRISLRFTWRIPHGARQQLRNWWAEFGWPGPPSNPPPRRRRVATR